MIFTACSEQTQTGSEACRLSSWIPHLEPDQVPAPTTPGNVLHVDSGTEAAHTQQGERDAKET